MASIIIGLTIFGVSSIGYAVFATVKAHRNKRKETKYHQKVQEFTVKQGYPLHNNYNYLSNPEQKRMIKSQRNPEDNIVFREIGQIIIENQ